MKPLKRITVNNASKNVTVGTQIVLADTFASRLIGLLGKRCLDAGCGVFIRPSSGVHTFGMLFAIDVVALDNNLRVLNIWPRLRPFRLTRISFRINCVLELAAGEIARCKISRGDQLEVHDSALTLNTQLR